MRSPLDRLARKNDAMSWSSGVGHAGLISVTANPGALWPARCPRDQGHVPAPTEYRVYVV